MAKPVWQKLLAVPAAKNHVSGPVWGHTDQHGMAAIGKKGAQYQRKVRKTEQYLEVIFEGRFAGTQDQYLVHLLATGPTPRCLGYVSGRTRMIHRRTTAATAGGVVLICHKTPCTARMGRDHHPQNEQAHKCQAGNFHTYSLSVHFAESQQPDWQSNDFGAFIAR